MEPGQRGTTTIADRVVARIASRAVDETDDVGGTDRGMLGIKMGRRAKAEASVDDRFVTARVQLSVVYPAPVREATRRARERVRDRVESLTGLTVRQVDIDVAAFNMAPPKESRARVDKGGG